MLCRALLVFLVMAVNDWCWVRWSTSTNDGKRWSAANWSVAIYVLNAISVIEYVGDHRMIAPALLGAYVGTALGVRTK